MSRLAIGLLFTLSLASAALAFALAKSDGYALATGAVVLGLILTKYSAVIMGIVLVLYIAAHKRREPEALIIDVPSLSQTPTFHDILLTAMFHTAQLDGNISQNTLQTLLRSYKMLSGQTVTPQMISEKYAQTAHTSELLEIMTPFTQIERQTIIKASLDVAVVDGPLSVARYRFLLELNSALDRGGDLFREQICVAFRADDPETSSALAA